MGEFDNNTDREKAVAGGIALVGTLGCALWIIVPLVIIFIGMIAVTFGE